MSCDCKAELPSPIPSPARMETWPTYICLVLKHARQHLTILAWLCCILPTSALLQNRTIDNHFGDDYDKAVPTYSPLNQFYEGSIFCDDSIMMCRLAKLIDRSRSNHLTWEGGTSMVVDEVKVSFRFTGAFITSCQETHTP